MPSFVWHLFPWPWVSTCEPIGTMHTCPRAITGSSPHRLMKMDWAQEGSLNSPNSTATTFLVLICPPSCPCWCLIVPTSLPPTMCTYLLTQRHRCPGPGVWSWLVVTASPHVFVTSRKCHVTRMLIHTVCSVGSKSHFAQFTHLCGNRPILLSGTYFWVDKHRIGLLVLQCSCWAVPVHQLAVHQLAVLFSSRCSSMLLACF